MFKFNRLVGIVAVCAIVGVAFGAAIKIKALTPVGPGLIENPSGDGMAIMNYHPGNNETEVTVAITDFVPETGYLISVDYGIYAAHVTTNASGNANYHGFILDDVCGSEPQVCVYVWIDEDVDEVRDDVEIRASGCTPCP